MVTVSWLSQATGIHLGNIGAPVGAFLGSVIPGVGTALGAGLGQAIGGVGAGHGVAKSALEGAGVYGGSKLAGAISGMGGAPKASIDPEGDALYGTETTPDPPSSGIGGYLRSLLPSGGGSATPGQPGGTSTNPWLLGLAGLQGANSAYLGQKSNALSDKALKGVEANYAERAPLRAAGLRGLLNPTAPDTSQLSTIAQRNPYAAAPRPPAQLPLAA